MLRTLRVLAAISFVWIVGLFLLRVTSIANGVPFTPFSLLSTLGGELGFAAGILVLVITASRRQIAWCALFALLLALLHVLPLLIFRSLLPFPNSPYPNFLDLNTLPPAIFGRYTWVVLLPALIPALAFIYAAKVLAAEESASVLPEVPRTPLRP